MSTDALFVEVDFQQCRKHGQKICGDAFQSQKLPGQERAISVLSDGLGSGVKANILASMTASMAIRFAASDMDFLHCAEIMMDALPVCQVRKISYATFTIVDCKMHGATRIIEMDNPSFVLLRGGEAVRLPAREMASPRWQERTLRFTQIAMQPEDRIVLYTDGISQSGLGNRAYPLGWREEGCQRFVAEKVNADPTVSARELAGELIREALRKEKYHRAQDDMSAGVIYFRRPRRLIVLTGPPFSKERDAEYAGMLRDFQGHKVICGGTTAGIVGRVLGRQVHLDLHSSCPDLPPVSRMEGVDLITEGILTLTKAIQLMEHDEPLREGNPAAMLVNLMRESDVIQFIVGSHINEAHQDPSLPLDIEIRRNIVRRMAKVLEERYLKEVSIMCI